MSINPKTLLIECNLSTSSLGDKNTFTTEVPAGIKLETGDTISVVDVAVNSKGIGGSMIQIPLNQQESVMATNKISFNVGKYLCTGSRFCCPMPHNAYAIDSINAPRPPSGGVYIPNPNYGYAQPAANINSGSYQAQGNLPYINADFVGSSAWREFKGSHHYDREIYTKVGADSTNRTLNIKLHSILAPKEIDGKHSTSIIPCNITPSKTYDFESDKCNIEIPFGYESAENIARLITDQFHSGQIINPRVVTPLVSDKTNVYTNARPNPAVTNAFVKIKTANAIDSRVVSGDPSSPTAGDFFLGQYANSLYDNLYFRQPNRWIYGERLNHLASFDPRSPDHLGPVIESPIINLCLKFGETQKSLLTITNLYAQDLQLATSLTDGDNLNMKLWKDFTDNNEIYNGTSDDYETDPDNWICFCDIGRYNDEKSYVQGDGTSTEPTPPPNPDITYFEGVSVALQPIWLDVPQGGEDQIEGLVAKYRVGYHSRFIESMYDNKKLSDTQRIAEGYKFVEELIIDGKKINVKDQLKKTNMMFAIVSRPVGTPTPDDFFYCFFSAGVCELKIDGVYQPTTSVFGADLNKYKLQYFGFDPTFFRNTAALAINTSESDNGDGGDDAGGSQAWMRYCNYIQLGSPNSAIEWDDELERFGFSNFHFPYFVVGNAGGATSISLMRTYEPLDDAKNSLPDYPQIPYPTLVYDFGEGGVGKANITTPLFWGYSGSTILSLDGLAINDTDFTNFIPIHSKNFKNTPLSRLGFTYDGIFPIGAPDVIYNKATAGNFLRFPYETPRPITTNPRIITTYDYALGANYVKRGSADLKSAYDLNINNNIPSSTNVTSVLIAAKNLPVKLVNPYWLIQSNILPSSNYLNFYGTKSNILAVVNRAFTSNDYAYAMGATTELVVETPMVITEIKTAVFNNDFTIPKLDSGCVVLYKITKNYLEENQLLEMLEEKASKAK